MSRLVCARRIRCRPVDGSLAFEPAYSCQLYKYFIDRVAYVGLYRDMKEELGMKRARRDNDLTVRQTDKVLT